VRIELDETSPYAVIMPAYNAERFIEAALRSVATQDRRPREVIVVDDGSSDQTPARASAAGVTLLRHTSPQGPASARNRAVRASTAPLLAFLDADDLWLPSHVSRLISLFDDRRVVFAASQAVMFGALTGALPLGGGESVTWDLSDDLIQKNPITQSAVMVTRFAFKHIGGYDERYRLGEDYDLWQRLTCDGMFAADREYTTRYRVYVGQSTHGNAAELTRIAWTILRAAVMRRLENATASEAARVGGLVLERGRQELTNLVKTGDRESLTALRLQLNELQRELRPLGINTRSSRLSENLTRILHDLRCGATAAVKRVRRKTVRPVTDDV